MHQLRKSLAFSLLGFLAFSLSITSIGSAQENTIPTQVKGVSAQAQGGNINLRWTSLPASEVTGYKLYYGPESSVTSGGVYYWEELIEGNVSSYSLEGLASGDYYFAMTGVNAAGVESAEYSEEVKVVLGEALETSSNSNAPQNAPKTPENLSSAPESVTTDLFVVSAEPINPKQVVVTMSAPVIIQGSYNVLTIERIDTEQDMFLGSFSASENKINVTVHDDDFVPGARYRLTVSSQVTDLQGNPVRSGITDTVEFETEFFQASVQNKKETFSLATENDDLATAPEENPEDVSGESGVPSVNPDYAQVDNTESTVQEGDLAIVDRGNNGEIPAPANFDTTPPADVKNLRYDDSRLASEKIVPVFWEGDFATSDVLIQKVYVEENGVLSDQVITLGALETSTQISVRPDRDYKVTVISIDASGNQSPGAVVKFGTYLNRTGADYTLLYSFILIGILISATLRLGRISIRS